MSSAPFSLHQDAKRKSLSLSERDLSGVSTNKTPTVVTKPTAHSDSVKNGSNEVWFPTKL